MKSDSPLRYVSAATRLIDRGHSRGWPSVGAPVRAISVGLGSGAEALGDEPGNSDDELERIDWLRQVHVVAAGERENAILGTRVGRERRGRESPQRLVQLPHGSNELQAV